MSALIRIACLADAAALNALYNPFILTSVATFETAPIDEGARRLWLETRFSNPRCPVVVAEAAGTIAGFANASPFDERAAYETSIKVSVFIAPGWQGRGIGGQLYEALFAEVAKADVHRAYALIVSPNPASVKLHERFGFRHISTLDEVGRKFGRYYSVMWFEKRL